ncbi:CHC2 zinc finger domain-containing protein (plasmid) [Micrococcaceae bacterium Sec5.7]
MTPAPVSRSSLDRVIAALENRGYPIKRSDRFMTLCPCHADRTPSMHVTWEDGKVMLFCFSCSNSGSATFEDLARGIGLEPSDLFDEPLPPRDSRPNASVTKKPVERRKPLPQILPSADDSNGALQPRHRFETTATYDYVDAEGNLVQQVIREECKVKAHPSKRFKQHFVDTATGEIVNQKPAGFVPVPYNLPAVLAAVQAGKTIYLVEGEKDADTAAAHKLVATTNAQGAGVFPKELAMWLLGYRENGEALQTKVRVVADRDLAGYRRAANLYQVLTDIGVKPTIVLPATKDPKSDLTDHFEAGYGTGDFIPTSLQTVQLLAQLEDIRQALKHVDAACEQSEARFRLALDTSDETTQEEEKSAAESWAKEGSRRLSSIRELADIGGEVNADDAQLVTAIGEVRDQAFARVNDTYTTLGLKAPASVLDRQGGEVVPFAKPTGPVVAPGVYADDPAPHVPNTTVTYRVRRGETVKVTEKFSEDEGVKYRYDSVMNCWAEVIDQFVEDDGLESEFSRPSLGMRVKFRRWRRDENQRPIRLPDGSFEIEEQIVTWTADTIQKGKWAEEIPWYGAAALASTSRRGKDAAFDGILKAVQGPAQKTAKYTSTGWRETPDGRIFIHAGGAISATGPVEADVALPDAMAVYRMPDPTTDAGRLREAWMEGVKPLLKDIPARIVYPMLGFVFESVFADRMKVTLHFQGGRSSYKTACANIGMQFFAPGIHFGNKREVVSGANSGGTALGILRTAAICANMPVLVDDFAPDGDPKRAQKKLGDVARINYNGSLRAVGTVNGGVRNDRPLNTGLITTGELGPDDSAETRLLTLLLSPGDIQNAQDLFPRLEHTVARRGRALLGSSLIQYLAETLDEEIAERAHWQDHRGEPGNPYDFWVEQIRKLPHDSSLEGRFSDSAQWCSHGIRLMLRMMVTRGALSQEEATNILARADQGILEALALQNDVAGDSGHRLINYLKDAIASNEAHLSNADGGMPEDAHNFGWVSRGSSTFNGILQEQNWVPMGTKIGVIKNGRAFLIPSVVLGIANQMASRADATFGESQVSIASAMLSHGWIVPDRDGKHANQRRISGKKMRVWDIPIAVLLGEDDIPDDGPGSTPEPPVAPASPPLFPDGTPAGPTNDAPVPGTHHPSDELQPKEGQMPQSHTFVDVTGEVVLMDHLSQWEDCIKCQEQAAGAIDGLPIHMKCWNASMEALRVEQQSLTANAPAVVVDPAPTAPAPVETPLPATSTIEDESVPLEDPADPTAASKPESESAQLPTFDAALAVLDVDGLHIPGQALRPLETMPAHMGEVADLAASLNLGTIVRKTKNQAGKWNYKAAPGQFYITIEATKLLLGLEDLPGDRTQRNELIKAHTTGHPFVTQALDQGWLMSKEGKFLGGTTRMWRKDDNRRAMITLIPMLGDDAYPAIVEFRKDGKPKGPAKADVIATRLQRLAAALQYPYTVSASSTGLDLLSETRKDREETLAPLEPVPPATIPGLVLDYNWSRKPSAEEAEHEFIHAYDRGASYLAAADTVFGIGHATHLTNNPTFDPKLPGYWRINIPPAEEWLHPSVFNPQGTMSYDDYWYTTETLTFATKDLGYEIEPLEAYVWEKSGRIFSGFVKRIVDARTLLDTADPDDQAARDIIKSMYVRTFGMIGSHEHQAGRQGYAPERYDTIKGRAGANILRRIIDIGKKTGRWPVAAYTDALLYTSNNPDGAAAWPGEPKTFGRKPGQYKHEGTAKLADLQKYLTGSGFDLEARNLFK